MFVCFAFGWSGLCHLSIFYSSEKRIAIDSIQLSARRLKQNYKNVIKKGTDVNVSTERGFPASESSLRFHGQTSSETSVYRHLVFAWIHILFYVSVSVTLHFKVAQPWSIEVTFQWSLIPLKTVNSHLLGLLRPYKEDRSLLEALDICHFF